MAIEDYWQKKGISLAAVLVVIELTDTSWNVCGLDCVTFVMRVFSSITAVHGNFPKSRHFWIYYGFYLS